MNKSKDVKFIIKLSLILFSIVFISTILLTLCNYLTKDKIALIEEQYADDARRTVIADADFNAIDFSALDEDIINQIKPYNPISVHKATINDEFAGFCVNVAPQGFGGLINMIVGIAPDMSFTGVEIVSMSETPGLGAKAQDEKFTSQYSMNKKGELVCVKNVSSPAENEINAISGATITSKAVTKGANDAMKIAEILMKEVE